MGATGSTHALATALYARRLGAHPTVFRWPQEMHATSAQVDVRLRGLATVHDTTWPPGAYARAALYRLRHAARWIPAGGTSALGILGHVDAALEVVEQVRSGLLPAPARVVVPLGTGGTAAGLVLGFAIAGLETEVVGVQVVPRIVANRARVAALAASARRLLARTTGAGVALASRSRFSIDRGFYGGAYGRETTAGRAADARYRAAHAGAKLDPTYSAKACAAAFARCDDRPTLLWVTFDSRFLDSPE